MFEKLSFSLLPFLLKVLIVHPIYFLNICFWCYCEKCMLVLLTTPPRSWSSASIFKCNALISKSNQPVLHKTKSPTSFSIVHYICMYTTIRKIKYLLPFHYDFNEHHQCESDKISANKHLSATTFYFNTLFSHHKPIPVSKFFKWTYFLNVTHKIPLQTFGAKCSIIRHKMEHLG